jgi:glutaredoxin-like YruB-family protein
MEVIIYTTPTCTYCNAVKGFLGEHNISYTEYDISTDQEKAQEILNKTGQMAVPVIEIDGEIIIGFNRTEIAKKLGLT